MDEYNPLFNIDTSDNFLFIYVRDLIAIDINIFLILAAAVAGIALKIYRYKKDTVKVQPILGVVRPKK
jgi:hypothetical protein